MDKEIKPKYYSDVFEEKGFRFLKHDKPYDVWVKDDEAILHCMPCMKFMHYKGKQLVKSIRSYPTGVRSYIKSL